jgi:hypothetical protein
MGVVRNDTDYRPPTKTVAITAFTTGWYLNYEHLPTQADGPTPYLLTGLEKSRAT